MAVNKIKLAWVENDKSRAKKLMKIRVWLMKKVKELTILCAVRACMIMFSPNDIEPIVWPSVEKAHDLLDGFFALPEIEKKKKEKSLETYLKEKTKKVQENFMKTQKKHMNYVTDQLMEELHHGRRIDDLGLSEINALISFSRDNIILHRKKLEFVQHSPLRDPPVPPFKVQFEELTATANDVIIRGGQVDERTWKNYEETKRVSIGNALRGNQSYYLVDKWVFASPEPPKPRTFQPIEMDLVSYNKSPKHVLYEGSSRNKNFYLDIEQVRAPIMTLHGLVGSVFHQLQHRIINTPTMDTSEPRQHPFDFMSRELGVKEEVSTVNNGDSQFHGRSNTRAVNDGIHQ